MSAADFLKPRLPALDDAASQWLKGVLIFLVAVDHNDYFRVVNEPLFRPFTFHVIGFFLVNFYGAFFSVKPLMRFASERAVRYLWPFLCFYLLYALANAVGGQGWPQGADFLRGIVLGSFMTVKQGCGAAFMWFLPALLGFALLCRLAARLSERVLLIALGLSVPLHYLASTALVPAQDSVPLGLAIVVYLVPIVGGFFLLQSWQAFQRFARNPVGMLVCGFAYVLMHARMMQTGFNLEIGSLNVPSTQDSLLITLNLIAPVLALSVLWAMARLMAKHDRITQAVGRHSLGIYLLHPLCFHVWGMLIKAAGMQAWLAPMPLVAGLVSLFSAFALAWGLSVALAVEPLPGSLLFPRDGPALRALMPRRRLRGRYSE